MGRVLLLLLLTSSSSLVSSFGFAPSLSLFRSPAIRHSSSTSHPPSLAPTPMRLTPATALSSLKAVVSEDKRLELTLGELVKTLVSTCKIGTLATTLPLREDDDGVHRFGPQSPGTVEKWDKDGKEYPFGTLVSYVLNSDGWPVMLLANNAAHTRNINSNNRVALYCQNQDSTGQKGARATLVGDIVKIEDQDELSKMRESYTEVFPDQALPLQDDRFEKFFSLYKIEVKDIYYVSGFGVMSTWVTPDEFLKAQADPLADFANDLVREWNENHAKDYVSVARAFFQEELGFDVVEEPRLTFVDRFGVNFRFKFGIPTEDGQPQKYNFREYRIGFRVPAFNREEAQSAMFKVFQEAWEKNEGYLADDEAGGRHRLLLKRDDIDFTSTASPNNVT
uniref:CREG-like beta-barrel domain-containing protein n=1 Tax=Hemiselmis andersenii TaxID=464988 RepID=A0A6T8ING1_HEMAN|mmetsp:Transcript_23338/g.54255  ORF Transcript_23338/g.54255 Transcript_23338/m.54255 type:complete len:393 (+) Transcript_23338:44-1222(+)